jgi:hypothetical protein
LNGGGTITIQGGTSTTLTHNNLNLIAGPTATGGTLTIGNGSFTDTVEILGQLLLAGNGDTQQIGNSSKTDTINVDAATMTVTAATAINLAASGGTIKVGAGSDTIDIGSTTPTGPINIKTANTSLYQEPGTPDPVSAASINIQNTGTTGNIFIGTGCTSTTAGEAPVIFNNVNNGTSVTVQNVAFYTGQNVCYVSAGATFVTASSRRYKKNDRPSIGREFINLLRPVSYELIHRKIWEQGLTEADLTGSEKVGAGERAHGLIAEEVVAAARKLNYQFDDAFGDGMQGGINYSALIAPLIKMAQEHDAIILSYEKRIEILETALGVHRATPASEHSDASYGLIETPKVNPIAEMEVISEPEISGDDEW